MNLPGLIPLTQRAQLDARVAVYGKPKSGRSVLAATWPSPLLLNPAAESGYESLRHPQTGEFMFQSVALGKTHGAFCRGEGGVPISRELLQWADILNRVVQTRKVPWAAPDGRPARMPQTLVLGGFSTVLQMVFEEGEFEFVTQAAKPDPQKAWGVVLAFTRRLMHLINSLPLHVFIELGAKDIYPDAGAKGAERGKPIGVQADIPGQSKEVIGHAVHALLYQEQVGEMKPIYRTHFASSPKAKTLVRHAVFRQAGAYIDNLSYDHFAGALGLPHITQCDPEHPRCQPGRWPWDAHWHV